jgi:hypothetical protein
MDDLIRHMIKSHPEGWNQPLHWQDDFLEPAFAADLIPKEQVFRFIDAYHGTAPHLRSRARVDHNQQHLNVKIEYGSHWGLEQIKSLDLDLLRQVKRVRVDGQHVATTDRNHYGQGIQVQVKLGHLSPGDHELQVELDLALVKKKHLVGFNEQIARVEDWPPAERRWTVTGTKTLQILASDCEPITLPTDPALDPMLQHAIRVKNLLVRTEAGKVKLALTIAVDQSVQVPLSFDVTVQLGENTIELGPLSHASLDHTTEHTKTSILNDLAPDIEEATVRLTPHPVHLRLNPDATKAWDKPIVFETVLLDRYD